MSTLMSCYPGDEAVGVILAASLGVTLISTTAWLVARFLRGKGALRHFVTPLHKGLLHSLHAG